VRNGSELGKTDGKIVYTENKCSRQWTEDQSSIVGGLETAERTKKRHAPTKKKKLERIHTLAKINCKNNSYRTYTPTKNYNVKQVQ
jgi:hypothetical protein